MNIKKIPLKPGVYQFLDKKGKILYIGRATLLRRRVSQYFQKNIDPRIAEMVSLAKRIKFTETDSVLEAILLEANYIKKYWPPYNIKEKDHRSFLYVIFLKANYPRPILIRERELKKFPAPAKIFGPFRNYNLLKNSLKIIRRIFPYGNCPPLSGKPCFDRQIGLCPGSCTGEISKKDYQKNIKNIILLFSGEKKRLMKKLMKENPAQAQALKQITDVSLITNDELRVTNSEFNRIEGYDISHFSGHETYGAMVVFTESEPDNTQYRLFKIKSAPKHDDLAALSEVLIRRFNHPEWRFPDLIMIDGGLPQIRQAVKVLQALKINIPLVGISKLQHDKLIFPAKMKKDYCAIITAQKSIVLKVRNEAHRFAKKSSQRARTLF